MGKQSEEVVSDAVTCKDKIVSFLANNRGIAFEVEELYHEIGGTKDNIRRCTYQLADDGVIYRQDIVPKKGQPAKYYLPSFWNSDRNCKNSDHIRSLEFCPSTTVVVENSDHGINNNGSEFYLSTTGVSAHSDPVSANFSDRATPFSDPKNADHGSEYAESIVVDNQNSDHGSDPFCNRVPDFSDGAIQNFEENSDHGSDPRSEFFEQEFTPPPPPDAIAPEVELPSPVKVLYNSPLGQLKAIAEPITVNNWKFSLILADTLEVILTQENRTTVKKAANKLKEIKDSWLKSLSFRVHRIEGLKYQWIEDCRCIEVRPHFNAACVAFIFQCPDGELVQKLAKNSDEFEVVRS